MHVLALLGYLSFGLSLRCSPNRRSARDCCIHSLRSAFFFPSLLTSVPPSDLRGAHQDVSRSMFGLSSPPYVPPNAPRWSSSLGAMFGIGGNNNNNTGGGAVEESWGPEGGGSHGAPGGGGGGGPQTIGAGVLGGLAEAEDGPLPLDILPRNKQPLAIDRRVDDLLRLLRPAPRAEGYRSSVFRFVTRQVCFVLMFVCVSVYVLLTFEQ